MGKYYLLKHCAREIENLIYLIDSILFHRQFYDLIEIFRIGGYCPSTNYLFLGT